MSKGIICQIQRFALNDGPGIRTLVFLKGCPMRCKWCSNPETQHLQPELYHYSHKCVFCGKCAEVCPNKAITFDPTEPKISTNRDKCSACGKCVEVCSEKARNIVGVEMSTEQVIEEIKKDIPFYIRQGGGVTLSGGEPFVQYKFAKDILKRCQEEYINTAIETTAHIPWKTLSQFLKYLDHVLVDIKHMDPIKHQEFTGVRNNLILENIARLDEINFDYIIRIPIIPKINDDKANIEKLISYITSLKNLKEVHLLPYHTLGKSKYRYLERTYELPDLVLNRNDVKNIANVIELYGVHVIIGG